MIFLVSLFVVLLNVNLYDNIMTNIAIQCYVFKVGIDKFNSTVCLYITQCNVLSSLK